MVLTHIPLIISDIKHFSFTCLSFVYLVWKNVYSVPLPIFKLGYLEFLLLSCMSSLYILDINSLLEMWFVNIFSHPIGCLSILLIASFIVKKHFSLM